ncbi:hypothetical protein Acr_12g0001930 [Actinidia rufa]|uniref:Uncharacterized protein n=1 Tax=Actinidia rufa TaxID=165716 RepID=A0A7J0FG29_9ERIC|nr:hypothetical protein Acr_12g0001930 [Actinidia rufa]
MISSHSSPLFTYIKATPPSLKGRPSVLPRSIDKAEEQLDCCCLLLRPSASSPLDNRAHPMANTSQAPDLEGFHHEIHGMAEHMRIMNENNAHLIQLLIAVNPPPPVVPLIPEIELSHHFHRLGDDHSQNNCREEYLLAEMIRPYAGTRPPPKRSQNLDACLDAINTGASAPETEGLKDCVKRFNHAILEVEDPSDKMAIMAMMEGLRLGPMFDFLSKNVLETLFAL